MKKLILLLLFIPLVSTTQEFKYQNNIASVVFNVDSISSEEIHSRAVRAIANIYNNANNVIQMNDKESGKLVIKGSSSIIINNPIKSMYPKNKYISQGWELFYNHTINIDSKDGRYRIVYTVSNPEYDGGPNVVGNISFDGVKFFNYENSDKQDITSYIEAKLNSPGMGILGKKRKALYSEALSKMPADIVEQLKYDTKQVCLRINDAIQQNSILESNSILNDDF